MKLDLVVSLESVNNAIRQIDEYKKSLDKKCEELSEALARYGEARVRVVYDTAPYDIQPSGSWETADINVYVEETDDGYAVIANGREVCFVEFGAGVYYNGSEPYLGTRPQGVVGIGQYGKGRGKQDMWVFGSGPDKVWTHGTPASNGMYYAGQDMRRAIADEARRIFKDD